MNGPEPQKVARRQLQVEQTPVGSGPGGVEAGAGVSETAIPALGEQEAVVAPEIASAPPRRFHGSVFLDALRVGADAGKVAQEVIAHLVGLPGAQVRITLEIEATVPGGIPDQVVRTVTENSRTLKFSSHGFERE